jgi:hypothetical protein
MGKEPKGGMKGPGVKNAHGDAERGVVEKSLLLDGVATRTGYSRAWLRVFGVGVFGGIIFGLLVEEIDSTGGLSRSVCPGIS